MRGGENLSVPCLDAILKGDYQGKIDQAQVAC